MPVLMPKGIHGSKSPHGTLTRYSSQGCRCEECREAAREWERQKYGKAIRPRAVVTAERRAAAEARDNHGTESRYVNLGCRCDLCRRASRDARRRRRSAVA